MQLKPGATNADIARLVEDLLGKLTLEEKTFMMSGHGFLEKYRDKTTFRWGETTYRAGAGNDRLGIPTLQFSDGPRGVATGHSTCFPVSMARGATFDPSLEERVGEVMGKEVRAHGGNLSGAVCINLLRHPAWGRAQETYGEDPYHLGEMGAGLTRGIQRHNVIATVKHYATNSIENARFKVNVQMTERVLREVYLPHFKRVVDEGVGSVMSAYNKVNGAYCGHNAHLLIDILKKDWGFEGFVHSDWIRGVYGTDAAAKGLDIENPDPIHFKKLAAAVKAGEVPRGAIDEAVRRILTTLYKFSVRLDPMKYTKQLVACPEHTAIAREVAEKAIVLLKNEGPILPLDAASPPSLAVIGRLADVENTGDHRSSWVRPPYCVTPLQGLRDYAGGKLDIQHDDGKSPEKAAEAARAADIAIVVVGYSWLNEGEYLMEGEWYAERPEDHEGPIGGDRTSLTLLPRDEALILAVAKANPRTIVCMMGGSAIVTETWRDKVPGILMLWYPGMEGGHALARILFGDVNPSGKLPCTFPRSAEQLPFFDKDADEITYELLHGYTKLDHEGLEAAFPYGFGLSYTSFAYDAPTAEIVGGEVRVKSRVRNTGTRAGEEIAQLYIGFEGSKVFRAKRLLRGFTRVALAPGEAKEIAFTVPRTSLAYWNEEENGWVVEAMDYTAYVGGSSHPADLKSARFEVR